MYNRNLLTLGSIFGLIYPADAPNYIQNNGQRTGGDNNNITQSPTTNPTNSPSYITQSTAHPTVQSTDSESPSSQENMENFQIEPLELLFIACALLLGCAGGALACHAYHHKNSKTLPAHNPMALHPRWSGIDTGHQGTLFKDTDDLIGDSVPSDAQIF
jgi:hypothetical protein